MESGFELVTPAVARACIAAHVLPHAADARLGEIVLAPHQVAASRRLRTLLSVHGGALLADDVGLGKTFVALAVARHYSRVLVIAPSGLRDMWRQAIPRAGVAAETTSYEALSRGPPDSNVGCEPGQPLEHPIRRLVILDEAHHARTSSSRRYPRIALLTAAAHTLLLTATPLPNRLGDLRSLVALFAGSRAWTMSADELSALVWRRTAATVPGIALPPVSQPRWIEIEDDSPCLDALLRLPPAVPPAGSGEAGALLVLGLVRQWASSRAALTAALRRSLARSLALHDAVAAGLLPTAAELRTWQLSEHSLQLGFPELLAAPLEGVIDQQSLARSLRTHADAVTQLLGQVARAPDPDHDRSRRIAALQRVHPGEKIVCFTEYAETAAAYWRHLRSLPGVARLSARGGEIASGHVSRDEVLRRFAPDGQRVRRPARIEDITLLVTTDLLAEGVDLRDATVVVHLDLPWSPARMEQRVGRARRMGSPAASIAVYAMRPPAAGEAVLELERRLRNKAAVACRAVGSSAVVLPAALSRADSGAELQSALLDRIARWSGPDAFALGGAEAAIASVIPAPDAGWLAVATTAHEPLLIASVRGRTGTDTALLSAACDLVERCTPANLPAERAGTWRRTLVARAVAAARRYTREAAAAEAVGPIADRGHARPPDGQPRTTGARQLARIHRAMQSAPPHEAPRIAALAAAARRLVCGRMTAGVEAQLQHLSTTIEDDAAWLAAVGGLACGPAAGPPACQLRAIIVLAPTAPSRA